MDQPKMSSPIQLVIFGAGGDLAWRKIAPALYNLWRKQLFPAQFAIVGIDGKDLSHEQFRDRFHDGVERFAGQETVDPATWKGFAQFIQFAKADFADSQAYEMLSALLDQGERGWGKTPERVYYLAVPPDIVPGIVERLGHSHLSRHSRCRSRVVVEKPFGRDLESARSLNEILSRNFDENQIFRIDHYLAKETVQNILAFRFANALFEPIWDRRYIDHIQITVAEKDGVEHRGHYYEQAGALRDMIQNHLMEILCFIAMEPPVSFEADEIRNKAADVLRAIRPLPIDKINRFAARGQYGPGWIEGERAVGYRQEPKVLPESPIETFAALKLHIDNWRWQDVPFYLRTGKRLPQRISTVSIHFRPVPHQSFPASTLASWRPNRLILRIQPKEAIVLRFQAKRPGFPVRLTPVSMRFDYCSAFKASPPDAYETLLFDIMLGDPTLFKRIDQVEAAWAVMMPVLASWDATPPEDFPNYPAGTWGPEEGQALIAQDRRNWLSPHLSDAPSENEQSYFCQ